jgi:serine/threonine protein kinase
VTPEIPTLPGLTNLSLLGRGGFADVYLARQAHLDRWVAAKVFRVTLADRAASDQFKAECQALGRLPRHPHIIAVYEADVLPDGRPYLVTEHCDGSLHQLVASRGPLSPSQVVDLGLTLARALMLAHSTGVLHGDVTPQNVLLRSTAPVLADFGLAVLRDYQGNVASGFTMAHAAPETVRYDGAIDRHTDIYGLGSTLYTALTGAPPFPARHGEEDTARAHRILHDDPARPTVAPPWLADLLMAMLAKDPAHRPTMTSVADVLAAGGAGSTVAPPPPAPAAAPPIAPPPGVPSYRPPADAPWAPAAAGPERTRSRQGSGFAGEPSPQPAHENTRLRASSASGTTDTPARRIRWPVITAAAVVAIALAGGLAFLFWPRDAAPAPVAAPVSAGVRIQLATPEDRGDSVVLSWSSASTLDYAVIVGESGQPPRDGTLVGRVTTYTVAVEPGKPYCFEVQGSSPTGVAESNVQSIRGAVCRFANP